MEYTIVHNTDRERFEVRVGETTGAYTEYMDVGTRRIFDHTVTDNRYQGQGLASALIRHALDATRTEGRQITTSCAFVAQFVEEHPEYEDLVT